MTNSKKAPKLTYNARSYIDLCNKILAAQRNSSYYGSGPGYNSKRYNKAVKEENKLCDRLEALVDRLEEIDIEQINNFYQCEMV